MKTRALIPIALAVYGLLSSVSPTIGKDGGSHIAFFGIAAAYADDEPDDKDDKDDSIGQHRGPVFDLSRPDHPQPPPGWSPPPGMPPPGGRGGGRPGWLLGRDFEDHDQARAAVQAGQVVPLRDILAIAERDFDGQMLEAELEHDDDEPWCYELKMLAPDGSILKLYYDAARPQLLKAKGHGLLRWYKGDPNALPPALEEAKRRMDAHHANRGDWFARGGKADHPERDGKGDTVEPPPPPPRPPTWYERGLHWLGLD